VLRRGKPAPDYIREFPKWRSYATLTLHIVVPWSKRPSLLRTKATRKTLLLRLTDKIARSRLILCANKPTFLQVKINPLLR
jgi:hypothetical protein